MNIQLINEDLLNALRKKARASARRRKNFDLRTMPEDTSQRMLNVMEPGTIVPIHRHDTTTETVVVHEPSVIFEAKDGAYVG